ncbi:Hint domain-containing protein [uncultured Tateyamaria sp.]|uniref:Hint domain-containing protein n=1 Tax=uncultured Tateyamaria sp. TaxID=455651 RepID=UPI0026302EA2|nr:Hint domain-containing protein [uncultured Tateyamaria sp.]
MTTISALFLGHMDELDTDEGNKSVEGLELSIRGLRGRHLGLRNKQFGSEDDPLHARAVEIEIDAAASSPGQLSYDREEEINLLSYDLGDGNGEQNTELDAYFQYSAPENFSGGATRQVAVTFADGTREFREVDIIQDTNGNLFMVFDGTRPGINNILAREPIESLQFSGTANANVLLDFTPTEEPVFSTFGPDFIVEGDDEDNLIDADYTGDPEGDLVDANDNRAENNDDVIQAGGGDDTVRAGQGDDDVSAGTGNDLVFGGDGSDTLRGEEGDDTLNGADGADVIDGDVGNDSLRGGAGADSISGGDGADSISGDQGSDTITGGAGNDTLFGEFDPVLGDNGADLIDGGAGADSIRGGNGDDTLLGGDGNDTILGDAGNDFIAGGRGNDQLVGGDGNDTFAASLSSDTIIGGAGKDTFDQSSNAGRENAIEFPIEVSVDQSGDGTVEDASLFEAFSHTIQSVESFVGSLRLDDVITITEAVARDQVQELDTAVGVATFPDGSTQSFGGNGQPTLPELLESTDGQPLSIQITSGDDEGQIGEICFEDFETINFSVTCFVSGTTILTNNGLVAIEDLEVGDLVTTMDHDNQPIRWIGKRRLSEAEIATHPHLLPIRISAGALGNCLPKTDLFVSPQHRMLVTSKIAWRVFGENEVLIAAKKLLTLDGVEQVTTAKDFWYFHILFDRHEVVFANGAPSESLFLGAESLKTMSPEAKAEIAAIFPETTDPNFGPSPARHIPQKGRQIQNFVTRLGRSAARRIGV